MSMDLLFRWGLYMEGLIKLVKCHGAAAGGLRTGGFSQTQRLSVVLAGLGLIP